MYSYREYTMSDSMQEALDKYAKDRTRVGHFLTAVLENNLQLAVSYADATNLAALPAFVIYVYNEMPAECWGSKEKVAAWLKKN